MSYCIGCGSRMDATAQFCPSCGLPARRVATQPGAKPGSRGLLIGTLVFAGFVGFLMLAVERNFSSVEADAEKYKQRDKQAYEQRMEKQKRELDTKRQAFNAMTNSEHLQNAETILKASSSNMAQLQVATDHLEAVRKTEPSNPNLSRLTSILAKKVTNAYLAQREAKEAALEAGAGSDSIGVSAQVRCRSVVEDSLKAPSTADFQSSLRDYVNYEGKFTWTIQTRVDAQNSFGAKIRSVFECKVRCTSVG